MYAYIRGKLTHSSPGFAVLEAAGVGYKIFVPASLFAQLPPLGSELQLHTSFIVREQSQALYGFSSEQERDVFDTLLGVSGIGPKLALSLIGHLSVYDLHRAISHADTPTITKVPGIGKKTAERIIIELRDKLPGLLPPGPSEFGIQLVRDPTTQKISDAMSALINLGYNQMTAQRAIKKTIQDMPETITIAELITYALKNV